MKTVSNVKDVQYENGDWVKSYRDIVDGEKYRFKTRGGMLWSNLNTRCYGITPNNQSYSLISNGFPDYNTFVTWCQSQYGYMKQEESGRFWELDKDIKYHNNKVYSEDSCIFVPHEVNSLFCATDKSRGMLPLGVSEHKRAYDTAYRMRCCMNKSTKEDKVYETVQDAHQAWQLAKITRLEEVASKYEDHTNLADALCLHIERIYNDFISNRETKSEWWNK